MLFSHTRNNPIVLALYVNAALLLGIILLLARRGNVPVLDPASALAQVPSIAGGQAGVYVVPAQFSNDLWGCYLLDADGQTLCTYAYDPGTRELKLTAARDFRYDRDLRNFATTPAPWEVRQMVEQEKQSEHTGANPSAPPQ